MDYNYESLLDQRFQKLCQALLIKEYENVQCFPIGMADGGRDATATVDGRSDTVFQIKFSHRPGSIKNVAKWITDALEGELPKIHQLKELGASKYILITNAFPTGKLKAGTIDKVNEYLAEKVPMDAVCWWRDDLDRRLDSSYELKLSYPSLLSGADMLRLLWENLGDGESAQKRKMALNAYFAHQAEQDSTIRFKQAQLLPSPLLELFVDVPAVPHSQHEEIDSRVLKSYLELLQTQANRGADVRRRQSRHRLSSILHATSMHQDRKVHSSFVMNAIRESGATGAANALLDGQFTENCPYLVLEGAPGQGKSTLSQYLAQLQRLRILNRSEDLSQIPSEHVSSPVALPFKIELRDLASWMKGEDPWSGNPSDQHDRARTLEGAISGHVERYSGGFEFKVSDIAFVAQSHPVLIILDALDEVADLEDRHRVVEEVVAAVARLEQGAKNLKVLVTSRPTAITSAPSFPETKFDYLTLAAIPSRLALEYAQKWSKARNLRKVDATEIGQILQQKMSAPHMAELAKNTMQLSILLSLIYHRGSSLPDKRTELYDAYVDSFFNREVEKSAVVRENRMLLISIHQHLAFYMHARAESNKTTGRIGVDELRQVVRDYLAKQRESEEVLDDLLTGMVERVVALVSRVEGTYEFEVQPLREYFAARYLYDTAPYVPATSTGFGTKPDRFDGIARNPYWMNVTRFFAGCFTQGELLDLAERVCSLCDLPEMAGKIYPRHLALALLQDWVFSQSKPATEKVIDKLYDSYGLRSAFISEHLRRSAVSGTSLNLALSSETGSSYFIESHLRGLFESPHSEYVRALAYVVGRQPQRDRDKVRQEWQNLYRSASAPRRVELIRLARLANLFHPDMELDLFRSESDMSVLLAMIDCDVASELIPSERHRDVVLASLNHADQFSIYGASAGAALPGALAVTRIPLWHYSVSHRYSDIFLAQSGFDDHSSETVRALQKIAKPLFETAASLHSDLSVWRSFLHDLDAEFGPSWTSTLIGLRSGSIVAPEERGVGADDLFSERHSFCDRIRNARRRGSQQEWWVEQLASAQTSSQQELWMAAAYCWASSDVLAALFEEIDDLLARLPAESLEKLSRLAANRYQMPRRASDPVKFPAAWQRQVPLTSPMLTLFFDRLEDSPQKDRMLSKRVPASKIHLDLARTMLQYAWKRWISGFLTEKQVSVVNKKFYIAGLISSFDLEVPSSADRRSLRPAWEAALKSSDRVPDMVLAAAEFELRRMGGRPKPVLRVADKQKWFS